MEDCNPYPPSLFLKRQLINKVLRCRLAGIIEYIVQKTFQPFWMVLEGNQCIELKLLHMCRFFSFFKAPEGLPEGSAVRLHD